MLANGYPKSQKINCDTKAILEPPSATSTPPNNPFSYDPKPDRYTYPWKTTKSYAGTCRRFILQLNDGSTAHIVYFKFS